MVVVKGWGGGTRELAFNGYGVSVGEDDKVLEMNSSDGCITM